MGLLLRYSNPWEYAKNVKKFIKRFMKTRASWKLLAIFCWGRETQILFRDVSTAMAINIHASMYKLYHKVDSEGEKCPWSWEGKVMGNKDRYEVGDWTWSKHTVHCYKTLKNIYLQRTKCLDSFPPIFLFLLSFIHLCFYFILIQLPFLFCSVQRHW